MVSSARTVSCASGVTTTVFAWLALVVPITAHSMIGNLHLPSGMAACLPAMILGFILAMPTEGWPGYAAHHYLSWIFLISVSLMTSLSLISPLSSPQVLLFITAFSWLLLVLLVEILEGPYLTSSPDLPEEYQTTTRGPLGISCCLKHINAT